MSLHPRIRREKELLRMMSDDRTPPHRACASRDALSRATRAHLDRLGVLLFPTHPSLLAALIGRRILASTERPVAERANTGRVVD